MVCEWDRQLLGTKRVIRRERRDAVTAAVDQCNLACTATAQVRVLCSILLAKTAQNCAHFNWFLVDLLRCNTIITRVKFNYSLLSLQKDMCTYLRVNKLNIPTECTNVRARTHTRTTNSFIRICLHVSHYASIRLWHTYILQCKWV